MAKDELNKFQKSGILLGIVNCMTLPLYCVDSRLGLLASLLVSVALLNKMEEVGVASRRFINYAEEAHSFFSGPCITRDMDNQMANILAGGDIIYDSFSRKNGT